MHSFGEGSEGIDEIKLLTSYFQITNEIVVKLLSNLKLYKPEFPMNTVDASTESKEEIIRQRVVKVFISAVDLLTKNLKIWKQMTEIESVKQSFSVK